MKDKRPNIWGDKRPEIETENMIRKAKRSWTKEFWEKDSERGECPVQQRSHRGKSLSRACWMWPTLSCFLSGFRCENLVQKKQGGTAGNTWTPEADKFVSNPYSVTY